MFVAVMQCNIIIYKMHKKIVFCKNLSNYKNGKLSTYPHQKPQKTWKTVEYKEVIHIFHTKKCEIGGILKGEKEQMFLLEVMKMGFCRKKGKKSLTFE